MKKPILLLTALFVLLNTACKKKKDDPAPSDDNDQPSDYYFTGTRGGVSFTYRDQEGGYQAGNSYYGSDMVNGSDTTFYQTLTASIEYFSFDEPDEDKPYFSLSTGYDAVGINNAVNLAQAFPLGTYNVSEDGYTLNYFKTTSGGISIGTGDYYSKNLGTVTFTEVTYLGLEDWFDDHVKNYKVKGSIDTYIYNSADATDSVRVIADFSLKYQSQGF